MKNVFSHLYVNFWINIGKKVNVTSHDINKLWTKKLLSYLCPRIAQTCVLLYLTAQIKMPSVLSYACNSIFRDKTLSALLGANGKVDLRGI